MADDHPPLHVGDHVRDRDETDSDATMLVAELPGERADEYDIDAIGRTVAAVNPEYPPDDAVVGVCYPQRTDVELDQVVYSFPRSRLQLVAPIHDIESDGGDGDADE